MLAASFKRSLITQIEKGKPAVRRGRKARGLEAEMARLPVRPTEALVFSIPSPFRPRPLPALRSTRLGPLIAILAISLLTAAPARAALVSTGACNESALSEPFAQWGDSSPYELVSQGDFEGSLSQWTLGGGAHRTPGSEPYATTGTLGKSSLALPAGASAQSPYTCVNASYPTFRFFARNGGLLSTVLVQVVYKTLLGPVAVPLGAVALSGSWQPTLPMLTGSVVGGLLSGGTAQAALRFTALTGESQIDDIYIDPRMR